MRPAYYAARRGPVGDWFTLLHPPYTMWHLSYVVIGACLAPSLDLVKLGATVSAFFLAVGVSAHALDEYKGRPLGTGIGSRALVAAAITGLGGAVVIGVAGVSRLGGWLVPFIVVGAVMVLAYNLEWFGGRLHTDLGFAAAWGGFPVLVGYFAQAERIDAVAGTAAVAALGVSLAQRSLSSPARLLRRRTLEAEGSIRLAAGEVISIGRSALLAPLESALRALSWSITILAAAMLMSRLL